MSIRLLASQKLSLDDHGACGLVNLTLRCTWLCQGGLIVVLCIEWNLLLLCLQNDVKGSSHKYELELVILFPKSS